MTLGMVALAGHVEVLYFTLLVMAFYGAWRLIEGGITHTEKRILWTFQHGLWLIAMAGIGLLLGAVQLAPAYELASRSFREGAAGYDQVIGWALPARHVLAFLMPSVFGSPVDHSIFDVFTWQWIPVTLNAAGSRIWTTEWGIKNYVEGAVYLGILPMALAGLAIWQWGVSLIPKPPPASPLQGGGGRKPEGVGGEAAFIALGGLSILFAFGTPAYALLYYGLPFINQSHSPFRWVWPLTLCVAMLAGYGWDALSRHPLRPSAPSPLHGGGLGWGLIGAGIVLLIGLIGGRMFYDPIAPLVDRIFNSLALAPNAFADGRMFFSYQFWNITWLALMLIVSGILVMFVGARGLSPLLAIMAVIIVTADLLIPIRDLHPASDPALLEAVPPSIQWLKDQQAADPLHPFRVMAYQAPGTTKTINANTLWLHGLEDASGYDSLIPGQYAKYMGMIQPQTDLPYNRITPIYADHAGALDSPLLDLLGVKYIVSEVEISNPRYKQVYHDSAVSLYRNTGVMPRAFSLPQSSQVISAADNPAEDLARYDVHQFVLINQPDAPADAPRSEARPATAAPAAITIYHPGEVWIDTEIKEPGWLILAESHFPGWRAWARPIGAGDQAEKEIPVYLVDGNFMGVRLEPGAWTVRFKYSPDSFKFGALGSFLAGLLALFLIGVWAWPLLYRAEGEGGSAKRVARNAITPVILNLFNKGILFVLTFASLRILGPEGAGSYRYAVVIWGWFEILSNFGLNTYLTREASRRKEDSSHLLGSTSLLRLGLAGLGIPALALFIWARQAFVSPALDQATLTTMWILYAGLFFSTLSTGLTALFYAFERAEIPAAIQTVSAFLTVGLGVGALLAGWGIIGLAGASLLVNAITFAILWQIGRGSLSIKMSHLIARPEHRHAPAPEKSLRREALTESFPLMINHLLATLFFRIDVVLLEALKGARVVGWYSVVYTWVDTIGIVPAFFTMALFPRMSQMAERDRPGLKRMYLLAVKLMTVLSIPTAIFTTLLAPVLINILGGPEYLPHGAIALQIFIWAMIIGWTNSVAQYVIIALNRQRTLTIAFVIGAGFNISANLIFIPLYSYPAAAVITIFSEAVLWIAFYVVIRQELGGIGWIGVLGRLGLAGLITAAVTWLLAMFNLWLGLIGGLLIYGAAVMLLRPFDAGEIETLSGALPGGIGKLAARWPKR
jgi:O-antigen/teichoic acid export membrane protein